ncbi:MAG: STAS domain-containing protein [Bacteroidia bacterium]|nr:STAS domain-containing protein [Bacteroidia bacterium]MDW8088542.1 STAS domain-containing protein [Bacteroidia bacterium]
MKYQVEELEEGVVFRPMEEVLSAAHTPQLKARFTLLAHSHTGGVVIDLSQVRTLDSSVLSALLLLRRILGESGRPLAIVAPTPAVQHIFALAKLNEIFTLMPTIEEALAYLQKQVDLTAKRAEEEEMMEEEELEEDWEEEELEDWEEEDWEEEEEWDEEDWEEDWEDIEEEEWESEEEEEEG